MYNQTVEREYSFVYDKRKVLHNSIRKVHLEEYFQKKRNSLFHSNKDEQVIEDIKNQIKNKKQYFKDINKPLNHLKTILDIIQDNIETKTSVKALKCLCQILKRNQTVFYQKLLNIDPHFLQFLKNLLTSGYEKIKIQALNILNWLSGAYKEQSLQSLWKLHLIDTLDEFIQSSPNPMIIRTSINFVGNMVTYESSINVVEHPVFDKIIWFFKHQNYDIKVEAHSCIETVLNHLEPQMVNFVLKKYKLLAVICFQLENVEYSTVDLSIIGLRIVKKYIEVNNSHKNDFNSAVDELQRVYDISSIIERIAFNITAERGPLLKASQMASQLIDIIAQYVNGDQL